jgi:hypothetical protein
MTNTVTNANIWLPDGKLNWLPDGRLNETNRYMYWLNPYGPKPPAAPSGVVVRTNALNKSSQEIKHVRLTNSLAIIKR